MIYGTTLILLLRLSVFGFPDAPTAPMEGYLTTIEWSASDSILNERLDSLTIDLAVLTSNPTTTAQDVMDLIAVMQDVEADSGTVIGVRRDILLKKARLAYEDILSNLDELPAEASPDALLFDLVESSDTEETGTLFDQSLDTSDFLENKPPIRHMLGKLPPIPLVYNNNVESIVKYYQTRARKVVQKWMERSATAIPELLPYIREEGLPDEIIYLSMIESGFNYNARSYAKAVGPWQFIKGTGTRYGLKINNWYDERRDPELSSRAAAAYLRDLHERFGDWFLAMASYNCGEGKVERHAKKYGYNYWLLNKLPKQTRGYVPSYLAARLIAESPETYGFSRPPEVKPMPTESIYITQCVELKALAACADVDLVTFKTMNPALLRSTTPPWGDSTFIRLPAGSVASGFWERLADIPVTKKSDLFAHKVRRGETLGSIAMTYGVPIDVIADFPENHIGRKYLIHEGQSLYIPAEFESNKSSKSRPKESRDDLESGIHRVKQGETLAGIARAHRLTLEHLASLNGLTMVSLIFPGQTLKLNGSPPTDMTTDYNDGSSRRHIVNSGDTLWAIARQYGVAIEDIKRVNGLKNKSVLRPGQTLSIPTNN